MQFDDNASFGNTSFGNVSFGNASFGMPPLAMPTRLLAAAAGGIPSPSSPPPTGAATVTPTRQWREAAEAEKQGKGALKGLRARGSPGRANRYDDPPLDLDDSDDDRSTGTGTGAAW